MIMKFFNKILNTDKSYKNLVNNINKGLLPVAVSGVPHLQKAIITASLADDTGKKLLIITPDESAANTLQTDLLSVGKKALVFPVRDLCLTDVLGLSREYEHKRIDTLFKVLNGDFDMLLVSVEAAIQFTMPRELLKKSAKILNVGDEFSIEELTEVLLSGGYIRTEQVEGTGQFSVRGGIVDIFTTNSENPVRIEYWDNTVDTINSFDILTQRRTENLEQVKITPATEILCDNNLLAEKLHKYLEKSHNLNSKAQKTLSDDIKMLKSGLEIPKDRYIKYIYKPTTIFDYFDSIVVVSESSAVSAGLKTVTARQSEDIKLYLEQGIISKEFVSFNLSSAEFDKKTEKALYLENFSRNSYPFALKDLITFNYKRLPAWQGDTNVLLEDLDFTLKNGGKCVIFAGEEKACRVLHDTLNEKGVPATIINSDTEVLPNGISIIKGGLSSGGEFTDQKLTVITRSFIYGTEKRRKIRADKNAISSLDELKIGDHVVHASHGIGIFAGINKITSNGITKDYIKINYAKTDVLYVPVTQLDLITKYIGANENGTVRLNKLGNSDWQKTRARVKKAVKDIAKELTALYAQRMSIKGYAFSEDTDLQTEFEAHFPYVETDDQIRCIKEIKDDMQRDVPMDRLLCGDVGYGKTEVALRAAFKCISEGKQCALLAPTTILAWQHYNTAIRRFDNMPVTVKMISRFVTPSAQKKIIDDVATGRLDMLIGTHRLISKDVKFKNLGLVIIDEEQRFGVEQKERLKKEYPNVDVLTLSATPIPRTLNMAMSGLRDMSAIEEAPGDRLPVQSYVMEQNEAVLIDAIRKEIRRSGQVYYLHNRVESIVQCAARLKEKLPDLRIEVAHGKMDEDTLSKVWQRLVEHEIDVLVCTTIIETGVDVPNANTLIIENADRMGLSQLHQLRGRVGRSPRRAYAYFCFKKDKQLSEVAEKRLEAIRAYTEFGAGFKIAMRDLEIRGAGNILGSEQHGNMESVGYDMYLKLLNDAINEEKGIVEKISDLECTVDLNISAHIPERYIASLPARLGIYKRIAAVKTNEDRLDVIDELCDRFGEPPKAVLGLIDIALLRNKAALLDIYEINEEKNAVNMFVNSVNEWQLQKLSVLGKRMCIMGNEKPYYNIKCLTGQKTEELIREISNIL